MSFAHSLLESVLLVLSLSMDAFAASLSYGAGKIKIPARSVVTISAICSGMLALALAAGTLLSALIPQPLTRWLCFSILFLMGFVRLCDDGIKAYIRKHEELNMHFSILDLRFILTVYANAEAADQDHSMTLSAKEASFLATALSLDGLAVGLGSALAGGSVVIPVLLSLALTALAVKAGSVLGNRLLHLLPFDLSCLSSLLLIVLAFLRL